MPHAMTEDHSHDDAEGQYRDPLPLTSMAHKQPADELRVVKSIGEALPATPRASPPIKRAK